MEITIISTEIIKPSSPTPAHLRTHKFFLPDNFGSNEYFSMILFYSSTQSKDAMKISSHLKNSLSKTLTYYYPLAGQNKDGASIDCNDHGAFFIETQVAVGDMSELLQKNDSNLFKQLVPLNEVAGGANDIKNVVVDYSSIRPPYDAYASLGSLYEQNHRHCNPTEMVGKHFTFDGRKIAALREKIGRGGYLDHPTRFEAISALISGTLIKQANVNRETHESTTKQIAVVSAINLRDKVVPPLPPQSLGNISTIGITKFPIDKGIDYHDLAVEINKSVKNVVDQYKRNMHVGSLVKGLENSMAFHISDVSRLPFYEADFGWGKPVLLSFIPGNYKAACLTPTNDGAGVQAFITLSKEEMAKFEQDPEFLSYTQPFLSKRARL
ncbi:Vinorine synthase-like [Melia azedarach]|uniref:Vinorine synthase-like n=1 Tax=Melia azedarach TaxID=155640 RepID=A0ACC1YEI6_MELAZ|nr:Vinorine synthase-like [Melia azedarach]